MKDYYKIGEISKIYGIGRDSLMYYEDIGILKPFRDKNGYRMYKLSDIWRLNLIKELRSLNFPMKKIKEYLSRERYLYLALNGRHSATTFEPSRGGKGIRLKTASPIFIEVNILKKYMIFRTTPDCP